METQRKHEVLYFGIVTTFSSNRPYCKQVLLWISYKEVLSALLEVLMYMTRTIVLNAQWYYLPSILIVDNSRESSTSFVSTPTVTQG
jgi:hypothetical protein